MKYSKLGPRLTQLEEMLIGTADATKQIAFTMGLVEGTVKIYANKLYTARGVSGRIELMAREISALQTQLCEALAGRSLVTVLPNGEIE